MLPIWVNQSSRGSIPTNPVAAFAGDSRTSQSFGTGSGRFLLTGRGLAAWTLPACVNCFQITHSDQYGISGDTSTQLLARWSAVLADPASIIVLLISTNDRRAANMTLQQSIDNVTTMVQSAAAVNKTVILANETPSFGANVLAGQQLTNHLGFRDWVPTFAASQPNVKFWNTWDSVPDSSYFFDGLHLNMKGAQAVGSSLAAVMQSTLPAIDYSEPTLPALNLNPTMAGTGGSKGSGLSGSLADNYTAGISSGAVGISVVCSKETISGTSYQVFTFSGTPGASTPSFFMRPTTNLSLLAGQNVDVMMDLIVDPGSSNILTATPEILIDADTDQLSRAIDGNVSPDTVPTAGYTGRYIAPTRTIPASGVVTQQAFLRAFFVPSVPVSLVLKVANFKARQRT